MNTHTVLSHWIISALAMSTGFSAAAIYHVQSLLPLVDQDLVSSLTGIGLAPTLAQTGCVLDILFLLPLDDRHNRRILILLKSTPLAALLLAYNSTGQLHSLLLVSLPMGMMAAMIQDIVPAVAILAPEGRRGKTVDTVMTSFLLGILPSRTVSGLVGEAFGWREMYQLVAVSIAVITAIMWKVLPRFTVHSTLGYPSLILPTARPWRRHFTLYHAALTRGSLPIAFSAFWPTLAVVLSEYYHMGSATAGVSGIVRAAGALAAPMAGHLVDKMGAAKVMRLGALLVTVSFALMFLLPTLLVQGQ